MQPILPMESNFPTGLCNRVKPYPIGSVQIGPLLTLGEWPNSSLASEYVKCGNVHTCFNAAAIPNAQSRVAFSYLEDLFSQKFWDAVQAEGPEALKPPSRAIWFFDWRASEKCHRWCTAEENAKLLSENGSPSQS